MPGSRHGASISSTFLRRYGTLIALALLIAVQHRLHAATSSPSQTLNVNLTQVATIVIVAVGMTLVIATGGIDLSVGSLMAIAGALAPMIFLGINAVADLRRGRRLRCLVCRCLVAGVLGLFNGWLITRFRIQPIVATLVLFIAGRGIAQVHDQRQSADLPEPEFQCDRARPRLRHSGAGDHHGRAGRCRRLGPTPHRVRPPHPGHRRQ